MVLYKKLLSDPANVYALPQPAYHDMGVMVPDEPAGLAVTSVTLSVPTYISAAQTHWHAAGPRPASDGTDVLFSPQEVQVPVYSIVVTSAT